MEKSIYGIYIQRVTLNYETITVEEMLKIIGIELDLNSRRLDKGKEGTFIRKCREINDSFIMTVKEAQRKVSSAVVSEDVVSADFTKGGIDLTDRAMRIKLERVGSFASSALVLPEINNVETLDLDKEFEQIQAMVNSSIRPSDTRILEFAAACYYKGEFDQRLTQITDCIKNAHLADEGLGRESSEPLRLATILPDALYAYGGK